MAKQELRRKIIATVLTVTALCAVLCICVWLLLGSNAFSDTIRIMMLICTVVLGIATLGLLVAKIQEIRALQEIIRSEAQTQPDDEAAHAALASLQTLDHTTIELPDSPQPAAPDAPAAPAATAAPAKGLFGRRGKKRDAMEQPAAETMAARPIEVVPPTPVTTSQAEPAQPQPATERRWKPIDFNAAIEARMRAEAAARQRAAQAAHQAEEAKRAEEARLAEEAKRAEEARLAEEAKRAEEARLAEETKRAEEARLAEEAKRAEEARLAEEAKRAEEARLAEEAKPAKDDTRPNPIVWDQSAVEIPFSIPAEDTPQAVTEVSFSIPAEPEAEHASVQVNVPVSAETEVTRRQAARHAQEARLSDESKAAEDAHLAEVARQAEELRLSHLARNHAAAAPQAAPAGEPATSVAEPAASAGEPAAFAALTTEPARDSEQKMPWTPVHFADAAPVRRASAPATDAPSGWVNTAQTAPLHSSAATVPKAPRQEAPVKEKRGLFGLFGRRKHKAKAEAAVRPVQAAAPAAPAPTAPAAHVTPVQPPVKQAEEPAAPTTRLNVKPIAWPAPPPPSRNFVHPPRSAMMSSPATAEQTRQGQNTAQDSAQSDKTQTQYWQKS